MDTQEYVHLTESAKINTFDVLYNRQKKIKKEQFYES